MVEARMDLTCYLHPAWAPFIRPAPSTRPWMDATPEAFAYRCLPLNIANAHGWEILNPHGFTAQWNGTMGVDAVTVTPDPGAAPDVRPALSLFGQGMLTFHVEGLFRTPPGWSLWIGGSPNRFKDALSPLTGVVETDWSPFTFTMNWRFTRPHTPVRFEAMEPFGFIFPLERAAVAGFRPRFAPLGDDPELEEQFTAWSRSRDDFHQRMKTDAGALPSERWQKHYYRGRDISGRELAQDHMAKLRLAPFDSASTPQVGEAPRDDAGLVDHPPALAEVEVLRAALARRDALLEALERQRALAPALSAIERVEQITGDEFLQHYYAPARPVILGGQMEGWPALTRWTPAYLKAEAGRPGALTADIRPLPELLDTGPQTRHTVTASPAGAFVRLHQATANSLTCQVRGARRVVLMPPSETGRLYETGDGFSAIADVEALTPDTGAYPRLAGARAYAVDLKAGDILFAPLGWWRQDRWLDEGVAIAFTGFRWRNGQA
jgi:hypothetical protein